MAPLPLMPMTVLEQLESLYNVKVTLPVGLYAPLRVALSPNVLLVPTMPVAGLALVVILGLVMPTTICSLASPQLVVKGALLVSPE
jgi:hypothetical protein